MVGSDGFGWSDAAPLLVSRVALVFTIVSLWWLYAGRGRLHVLPPHQAGFFQDQQGALLVLRLPLMFQNTGARTFVISDMECWFPDTAQAVPLRWGMTTNSLRADANYKQDAPVPVVVASRQTVCPIVEFRLPMPGVTLDAATHAVLVRGLVNGTYRDLVLLKVPVTAPMLALGHYGIITLLSDDFGQERANEAARRLGDRLRSVRRPR
jgi:hypothetical protein